MNKSTATLQIFLTTFLITFTMADSFAQEINSKKPRELIYTYIGPIASFAYNRIWYNDWATSERKNQILTGLSYSGGVAMNIFANNIIGEFSMKYIYNDNSNFSIQHLLFNFTGKYLWKINQTIWVTAGAGLYFETPPSTQNYTGGSGGKIVSGIIVNTTKESKLIADLSTSYGYWGLGENSTKLSPMFTLAFLFKIGHI